MIVTHRRLHGVLALVISGSVVAGQAPAFDVASVRPSAPGNSFISISLQPGGRLVAANVPLRLLIRIAFGLEEHQLLGGENWMNTDRYEVQATAGRDISGEEARSMLQALLADRFRLAAHRETRDLPIYELRIARADGRIGENLRRSQPECGPIRLPAGVPAPPPPPVRPGAAQAVPLGVGPVLRCPAMFAPGWVMGREVSMDLFALRLSVLAGRPVRNETGLQGMFDLDLIYTPDTGFAMAGPDAPALVTAMVEQLGLRLEPARGPVDVLVVDRIERPSEN